MLLFDGSSQTLSMTAGCSSTKEWFLSTGIVDGGSTSNQHAIADLFEAEFPSVNDLTLDCGQQQLETWMKTTGLKPKEKSRLRHAVANLKKELQSDASSENTSSLSFRNDTYQASRREVPKAPGTYVIPSHHDMEWKTVLLLGETGSGKTTLLNSMATFLWGIQLDDNYRYVLVPPPAELSTQAHSVTKKLTTYRIRPPRLMYGLNIIDTPGFGDTDGLKQDYETIEQIEHLLCNELDGLDAIFLVVRACGRLDAQITYVLNSVKRLFGKDAEPNMFILITFADGSRPPIVSALEAANMPVQHMFELNNSAFFTGFHPDKAIPLEMKLCYGPGDEIEVKSAPVGVLKRSQTASFWRMGYRSMSNLFFTLHNSTAFSLDKTRENLTLRRLLSDKLDTIHRRQGKRDKIIAGIRQCVVDIIKESTNADQNKSFVVDGVQSMKSKRKTKASFNITCPNCQHTCLFNGPKTTNVNIKRSRVIKNEYCTECPSKCHWSVHTVEPFEYRQQQKKTRSIQREKKKKYNESLSMLKRVDQKLTVLLRKVIEKESKIVDDLEECISIAKKLEAISMSSTIMETPEFYQKRQENQRWEKKAGWEERVCFLRTLEAKSKYCVAVTESMNLADVKSKLFAQAREALRDEIPSIKSAQVRCTVECAFRVLGATEDKLKRLTSNE